MTDPLRMADVCSGIGGATRGYQRAGFNVTGVDINNFRDYCGDSFMRLDAVEFLYTYGKLYDFLHASPPCFAHSALTKGTNQGRTYRDIIPEVREALKWTGVPWVMENVAGAPIRHDLMLCGEMFGLGVIRHRYFEFGNMDPLPKRTDPRHRGRVAGWRHGEYFDGPYVAVYGDGGGKGSVADWQRAMGIDWTADKGGIARAIPPDYAQHIGSHVAGRIGRSQEAGVK